MEKKSSDSSPEKSKSSEDQEKVELSPDESDKTLERTEFLEKQCMEDEPSEKSFSKPDFVIKETGTNLLARPILDSDSEQVQNLSSETTSIDVNEPKNPVEGDNLDRIPLKTDQISFETADVTSEQIETENVSKQSKSIQSCAENLNNPLLRRMLSNETLSESVTICHRICSNIEEQKLIDNGDEIVNEVKHSEENPRDRSCESDEKTPELDLDANSLISTAETEVSLSKQNSPISDSKQSKPSSIVQTESFSEEHRAHSSQRDSSFSISPLAISHNIQIETRLPKIDTSLENASLTVRALISPKKHKPSQLESQNSAYTEGLGLRLDQMLGLKTKQVFRKVGIPTDNLSPGNTQTNQMSKITKSTELSEHIKNTESSHETSQLSETLSVIEPSNTLQFDTLSPVADITQISTLSQTPPIVDPSNIVQSGTNSLVTGITEISRLSQSPPIANPLNTLQPSTNSLVTNSSETSQLAISSPILFEALTKQSSDFKQSETLSSLQEQGKSSQQKNLSPHKPNRKTRRPITESPDNFKSVQSSSKLPDIPFESASRNVRALVSPKKVRFSETPWSVIIFPRYRSEIRNPRSRIHQPLQTKCTVAPKEKFEGLAGKMQALLLASRKNAALEQPVPEFLQPRDPPPSNLSPQKSILKTKRLCSDSLDNIKDSKSSENEASSPKKICFSDVAESIKLLSLERETDLPSPSDLHTGNLSDEVKNLSMEKCDECSVIPDTIQNSNVTEFPLQEMNHPSNIPSIQSPNIPNLQPSSSEYFPHTPMDKLEEYATGIIANLFGVCDCKTSCNCSTNDSKVVNRSDSTSVYSESLPSTSSISIPHSVNEKEECADSELCSSGIDIETVNRPNSDSASESLPNTSDNSTPNMNRPQADTAHHDPVDNLICPEQSNEQNSVTPEEPANES